MGKRQMLKKLKDMAPVLKSAYENGSPIREIAEFYGVSITTVWHRLQEQGVEMRKRGPVSKRI